MWCSSIEPGDQFGVPQANHELGEIPNRNKFSLTLHMTSRPVRGRTLIRMGAMSTGKAATQGEHRSSETDVSKMHSFPFQWAVDSV